MTTPVRAEEFDMANILLQPRFGVEQTKIDGWKKTRAVDHFSWFVLRSLLRVFGVWCLCGMRCATSEGKEGSVNGHTCPNEKMRHDTPDTLAALLR